MLEKIRRKLSEALDALAGDPPVTRDELDRVLGEMRQELIEARARLREREGEFEDYEARLRALKERPDVTAADLAAIEAEVEKRRAELAEHRRVVADLTEKYKEAVRQRDVLPARDRRSRASETLREAGEEEIRDLERLEEEVDRRAAERSARREVEGALDGSGSGGGDGDRAVTDEEFREAEADALLEELKRRMGLDPGGDD